MTHITNMRKEGQRGGDRDMKRIFSKRYMVFNLIIIILNGFWTIGDIFLPVGMNGKFRLEFAIYIIPIYLVIGNYIFLHKTYIKDILYRYIIMILVVGINCLMNNIQFELDGKGLFGLIIHSNITDPMSWVVIKIYVSVALIILTIEWAIAVFIKYILQKYKSK